MADDDEFKLEEELFQTISSSVSKLGQWCIEISANQENFKADEVFTLDKQQSLSKVFQVLLENGLRLMDTDNPRISQPLIEFFTIYMKNKNKIQFGQDEVLSNVSRLLSVLVKRIPYPNWFIEMGGHTPDPDDWSNGRLDEQRFLREN